MKSRSTIFLLLVLLLIILGVLFIPRLIVVRNITCKNQYGSCDDLQLKEIKKSENKNINEAKKEISTYLKNNYSVKDYSIQYKAFNSLEVNILVGKALYCLKSESFNVFAFVDSEGKVLEFRENCNLPLVYINDKSPNVGEKVNDQVLSALFLTNQIFISYSIKEGKIIDNYLEILFPEGYKVIFPLDKDNYVLLGSLRLIINRLNSSESESKIRVDSIKVIDLRYTNPVLR